MLKYFHLIVGCLISMVLPLVAQAEPQLKLSATEVRQGQQLWLELNSDQALDPFKAQLAGQEVELFERDGHFFCFIGMAADQKTGGYTLRVLDAQKQVIVLQKIEVLPVHRSTQNIRYAPPKMTVEQEKKLAKEEALVDIARAARSPQAFWQGAFSTPVPHQVSAVYGIRRYLNGKYNGYHGGIDFLSPMGFGVKAPAAAKVALARYFAPYNSNGNTVFLDHGLGVTSVYLHLSKILVKEGQMVKKGEVIGLIGSTGRSTGPHLHWGVYLNGKNTDALNWIQFTQKWPMALPSDQAG